MYTQQLIHKIPTWKKSKYTKLWKFYRRIQRRLKVRKQNLFFKKGSVV